jgi:hypothetical protein
MEGTQQQKQNNSNFEPSLHVTGWGVDADPVNDPTYPMKMHTRSEHDGFAWNRPTLQEPDMEVLHSTERPTLPATFGETIPPAGLSGMIRRAAFTYSENSYGHWLPLMLADRVQMVEGLVGDLASGKVPNLWKELGYSAEWKYNRKSLITKLALMGGVAVGLGMLLTRRSRSSTASDQ